MRDAARRWIIFGRRHFGDMSNRPSIEGSAPIPSPDSLEDVVASTILLPISVLAAITVVTHVSQLFELTFRSYAYLAVALVALFAVPAASKLRSCLARMSLADRKAGLSLLLLGLIGATLAIVSHQPDRDDSYYLANARYFLDHAGAPLSLDVHCLVPESETPRSLTWGTSTPWEFLYAALHFVFRVDFLWGYYVFGPAVAGFLIPLALYSLTRVFVADHARALFGVSMALLLVFVLFETPQTFGSYSFVRVFQGKVFVLTVCLPALAAASLRFLTHRCLFHWATVLAICVAGLGANASAIVLFPPLALMMVGALWASGLRVSQRTFSRAVVLYGSAFAYLIAFALIYRFHFASELGFDSPAHADWRRSFLGHLGAFFPDHYYRSGWSFQELFGGVDQFLALMPYTPVAVTVSIVLAIAFSSGWVRRFLLAWVLLAVALFLNPWSGDFLIQHFTSPNIYWRMFYLLPFPLATALAGAHLHGRIKERFGLNLSWAGLGAFAALCLLSLWDRNLIEFPPRYKLPQAEYEAATAVHEQATPGPMLAPFPVAGILVMLSSDHPQIILRGRTDKVAATLLAATGHDAEAQLRRRAGTFARFGEPEDYEAFETVLGRYPLAAVVLHRRVLGSQTGAIALLRHHGFCAVLVTGDYQLFERCD